MAGFGKIDRYRKEKGSTTMKINQIWLYIPTENLGFNLRLESYIILKIVFGFSFNFQNYEIGLKNWQRIESIQLLMECHISITFLALAIFFHRMQNQSHVINLMNFIKIARDQRPNHHFFFSQNTENKPLLLLDQGIMLQTVVTHYYYPTSDEKKTK